MSNLERLSRDLLYYRQQLETEENQFRRNLLLTQILNVERSILNVARADRLRLESENKNMEEALRRIRERERDREGPR